MKRKFLIILITLCSLESFCQEEDVLREIAEALSDNGISAGSEMLAESIGELLSAPLQINHCDETQLSNSGLFSPYQVHGIIGYRQKYGPFFSLYELASIPGLNKELLELIAPLISFSFEKNNTGRRFADGLILSNVSAKLPVSHAYRNRDTTAVYAGHPFKSLTRIRYKKGSINAGLAIEKDPGELWFNKNKPEHLTGYVEYNAGRGIRKMILGNYRLHRGVGLVHGLGFHTRGKGINLNGYRNAYAKPFASSMEYDYYRGMYAQGQFGNYSIDFFISHKPEDISFHHAGNSTSLFDRIRRTGLHRTKNECKGAGLANQLSGGFSVNRSGRQWNTGISGTFSSMYLSKTGKDSLDTILNMTTIRPGISVYTVNFGSWYEFFGEAATGHELNFGVMLGGNLEINPAIACYFSIRTFQPGYSGHTPSVYGEGNDPENIRGFNAGIRITPFKFARLSMDTDISRNINALAHHAHPFFRMYHNLTFKYDLSQDIKTEIQLKIRSGEQYRTTEEPVCSQCNLNRKQMFRFRYDHRITDQFNVSFKWISSFLKNSKPSDHGYLFSQTYRISPAKKVTLTLRFLAFNVTAWENRIYLYEPGVRYSFLFPAWYGKGTQNLLVCRFKLTDWLTIRGKAGWKNYAHQFTTGSGNDIRPGNRVLDLELQLQADL
ncbi:MAG: helix-hairpin-helix domain-containing protein [Bacteroidales bacterium]|nr:helix-hairpin-helix domain-containing protein [Bacteroidales bacterium]